MAKWIKCEACNRMDPIENPMGANPQGWIEATEREDVRPNREYTACSARCMSLLMAARAKAAATGAKS